MTESKKENKSKIKSPLLRKEEEGYSPPFVPEYVFAADLSLRMPGFALIHLSSSGRMKIVATSICDNKRRKGTNGLLLTAIVASIKAMLSKVPAGAKITFVRERGFSRFPNETQALFKVVGVCDYVLTKDVIGNPKRELQVYPEYWEEIAPKSVKAIIAGSGNASKDEVMIALGDFVGPYEYGTLDESDAVAVGVSYLMVNCKARKVNGEPLTIVTYTPPSVRRKSGLYPSKKKKTEKDATVLPTAVL